MKILVSGACGFVGAELALGLRRVGHTVTGFDNFSRRGSEFNLPRLERGGVEFFRGDTRYEKDLAGVGGIDWVVDAAANPSVLARVDGKTGSRELLEHNLWGTVNLLEVCKRENAGMVLLSTSRVYSIRALLELPLDDEGDAFVLRQGMQGVGPLGVTEEFSTAAPISLYGASKLSSEQIALEYGAAFGFPVWINRYGVIAGAGQFGKPDQGIFSYWIHGWARKAPLKYIGFGGAGRQVRDCLHPDDLLDLVHRQIEDGERAGSGNARIFNVGGGERSATSLRQLSNWCAGEFGPHEVSPDLAPRPFDLPWVVLDASRAEETWDWRPNVGPLEIFDGIARHARAHPGWLDATCG